MFELETSERQKIQDMKSYIVMRQRYYDSVNSSKFDTFDIVDKLENARALNNPRRSLQYHGNDQMHLVIRPKYPKNSKTTNFTALNSLDHDYDGK